MQFFDNREKDEVQLQSLLAEFKEELQDRKDILSCNRYKWMSGFIESPCKDKALVIHGYLMGIHDSGVNVGSLSGLMSKIIISFDL